MAGTASQPRITLAGVKLRPRLGVTPGERRQPQPCEADVSLWGDFEAAFHTDTLEKAVDYSRVLAAVVDEAHAREYNLIEALAHSVARRVLTAFPVARVGVRLRKRPASLGGALEFVEIEIETE
jgi:dihydroneopterin aldolase